MYLISFLILTFLLPLLPGNFLRSLPLPVSLLILVFLVFFHFSADMSCRLRHF